MTKTTYAQDGRVQWRPCPSLRAIDIGACGECTAHDGHIVRTRSAPQHSVRAEIAYILHTYNTYLQFILNFMTKSR